MFNKFQTNKLYIVTKEIRVDINKVYQLNFKVLIYNYN
jgi:hypothetical protein